MSQITRRSVLAGACACGASVIAACASPATEAEPSAAQSAPEGEPTSPSASTATGSGVPVADVPVGSAILDTDRDTPVVISQPTEGEIHVVSASCTHQGCQVAVAEAELTCPCHGSRFDLTGAVLQGPAEQPLAAVPFTVVGDQVHVE